MKSFTAGMLLAGLSTITTGANAATILEYQTAESSSNATLAPSFADSAITGDAFAAGSGIGAASGGTYNFNGFETDNTSFADAVADNEVFTFGFDVNAGQTIDLTSFDIRLDRSGTGPDDFEVQVSVNGGAGISVLTYDFNDSSSGVDFIGVDLSSVPALVAGDSVVFTIGIFNAESTGGTFDLETINFGGEDPYSVRVYGDVVPEPSALALLGLGGLLVARRRKG